MLIVFIPEENNNSEKKGDISSYSETEIQNSNDIPLILNTKTALSIELEQDTSQKISVLNTQEEVITSEITDSVKDEINNIAIETINKLELPKEPLLILLNMLEEDSIRRGIEEEHKK